MRFTRKQVDEEIAKKTKELQSTVDKNLSDINSLKVDVDVAKKQAWFNLLFGIFCGLLIATGIVAMSDEGFLKFFYEAFACLKLGNLIF